jgi:hypothetical protein
MHVKAVETNFWSEAPMKIELLTTSETAAHLRNELASDAGEALLAVAYWGKGAAKELGFDTRTAPTRVICDLWSGLCNPNEIKALLKYGVQIKTRDRFHAKAYRISGGVIIGSSNASTNGLGFEASEARRNVELNISITSAEVAAEVQDWFETEWAKAEPVDRNSAEDARPFWEATQRNRPTQTSKTLLQGLAEGSPRLRNASLWLGAHTADEPDQSAKEAFRLHGRGRYTSKELDAAEDYYLFYVDSSGRWPVKPGDVVLDFEFERRSGIPDFHRMWRVRTDPFIPAASKRFPKSRIVLCDLIDDYRGIRLPKREASLIGKAISIHLDKHKKWEADTLPINYEFLLWMPLIKFWQEHKSLLTRVPLRSVA